MTTDIRLGAPDRGSRLRRVIGNAIVACVGGVLLLGAVQARAATVVTDSVVSQSTQTQTSIPVTFGQVFKKGDVPVGATVLATLNGQPIALQVDAKATNPDGSLRHAVLTAMVPSLPGGGTLPLMLASGSPAASMAHGAPISLSQLLATNYDAKVSLNIGGANYSVNARGLLQAADLSGECAAWDRQCDLWLSGPLVSAWVVNGPLTSANGATNPNLRVYFAVRAYAGTTPGTVGYVRTDIIVENTNAFAAQAQPQYTATLTSGSASYTSPALTQYTATRWHKVLWWNNAEPQVYLQQDTQYIQDSMAVSRYMSLKPDESFLASRRQFCMPLDHCDQTKAMSNVGAQPAIGPLPQWTSLYVVYPDVRAYNWMLANTDALGTYSIHYRDAATGLPVSIEKHPYVTVANWSFANRVAQQGGSNAASYGADLLAGCINNAVVTHCTTSWYGTGNPYSWDNEHQPAESYVPYMVTGDYYYMSELAFGASYNDLWSNPQYRGFSEGLIGPSHGALRAKAWTLRDLAEAAYLLPDTYPLKGEFNAVVRNSLAAWNTEYTDNPESNPLGTMNSSAVYSMNGGAHNGAAPWQHNFLTWSAGHAAELGFADAARLRNWLAQFEIGMMTDWQNNPAKGYCWLEASTYDVQVKDSSGNWLPSFTAVYQATFPTLVGLACNSPTMVQAMGTLMNQPWQVGKMPGYPYSATGYPANLQIGLAAIADSGLSNAAAAWNIFDTRSVKPSGSTAYNNYPNFALMPRSTPQSSGSVPPPTNPIPSSNPPTLPSLTATNPPPVPKEPPARLCNNAACGSSTVQSGASPAEPIRSVESMPSTQPVVSTTKSDSNGSVDINAGATSSTHPAVRAPADTLRFLVRLACIRFNAWCVRNLPQGLYVSAHENARAQPQPSLRVSSSEIGGSSLPRFAAIGSCNATARNQTAQQGCASKEQDARR